MRIEINLEASGSETSPAAIWIKGNGIFTGNK
jgi:hypothetical protein